MQFHRTDSRGNVILVTTDSSGRVLRQQVVGSNFEIKQSIPGGRGGVVFTDVRTGEQRGVLPSGKQFTGVTSEGVPITSEEQRRAEAERIRLEQPETRDVPVELSAQEVKPEADPVRRVNKQTGAVEEFRGGEFVKVGQTEPSQTELQRARINEMRLAGLKPFLEGELSPEGESRMNPTRREVVGSATARVSETSLTLTTTIDGKQEVVQSDVAPAGSVFDVGLIRQDLISQGFTVTETNGGLTATKPLKQTIFSGVSGRGVSSPEQFKSVDPSIIAFNEQVATRRGEIERPVSKLLGFEPEKAPQGFLPQFFAFGQELFGLGEDVAVTTVRGTEIGVKQVLRGDERQATFDTRPRGVLGLSTPGLSLSPAPGSPTLRSDVDTMALAPSARRSALALGTVGAFGVGGGIISSALPVVAPGVATTVASIPAPVVGGAVFGAFEAGANVPKVLSGQQTIESFAGRTTGAVVVGAGLGAVFSGKSARSQVRSNIDTAVSEAGIFELKAPRPSARAVANINEVLPREGVRNIAVDARNVGVRAKPEATLLERKLALEESKVDFPVESDIPKVTVERGVTGGSRGVTSDVIAETALRGERGVVDSVSIRRGLAQSELANIDKAVSDVGIRQFKQSRLTSQESANINRVFAEEGVASVKPPRVLGEVSRFTTEAKDLGFFEIKGQTRPVVQLVTRGRSSAGQVANIDKAVSDLGIFEVKAPVDVVGAQFPAVGKGRPLLVGEFADLPFVGERPVAVSIRTTLVKGDPGFIPALESFGQAKQFVTVSRLRSGQKLFEPSVLFDKQFVSSAEFVAQRGVSIPKGERFGLRLQEVFGRRTILPEEAFGELVTRVRPSARPFEVSLKQQTVETPANIMSEQLTLARSVTPFRGGGVKTTQQTRVIPRSGVSFEEFPLVFPPSSAPPVSTQIAPRGVVQSLSVRPLAFSGRQVTPLSSGVRPSEFGGVQLSLGVGGSALLSRERVATRLRERTSVRPRQVIRPFEQIKFRDIVLPRSEFGQRSLTRSRVSVREDTKVTEMFKQVTPLRTVNPFRDIVVPRQTQLVRPTQRLITRERISDPFFFREPPFKPTLTPFILPGGMSSGFIGGTGGRRFGRRRSLEYQPDITSALFKIRGKRPKGLGGLFTGLELRPLRL